MGLSSTLWSKRQPLWTGYPFCVCRGCISVIRQGRYHIPRSQFPLWASMTRGGQLPELLIQRLLVCQGPSMTESHAHCKESEADWKTFPVKSQQTFQTLSVCEWLCLCVCLEFEWWKDDVVCVCLVHSSMYACVHLTFKRTHIHKHTHPHGFLSCRASWRIQPGTGL